MAKKKYEVDLYYTTSYSTIVTAEDFNDAYEKALEKENTEEWRKEVLHNLSGDSNVDEIREI